MDKVEIAIPKSLYKRLVKLAEELGIDVDTFAVDLLREAISRYEEELGEGVELPEEEVQKIKDRLKSLGYLD